MNKRRDDYGLPWGPAELGRQVAKEARVDKNLQAAMSGYLGIKGRQVNDGKYFPEVETVLGISLRSHTNGTVSKNGHVPVDSGAITAAMSRPLPIYGTTAGAEGAILMELSAGEDARGPSAFLEVEDAYGLRICGTSMVPYAQDGNVLWIDPNELGVPGNHVLLIPAKDGFEKRRYVRFLVSEDETRWVVAQYNPPEQTTLLKSEWPTCVKIRSVEDIP